MIAKVVSQEFADRLNRSVPLESFEYPLWSLVFLLAAWRRRGSDRVLLLLFGACGAILLGITCGLWVGSVGRYFLQLLPANALGIAVLARVRSPEPDPDALPLPASSA